MSVLFKNARYLTPEFTVAEGCIGVSGRNIVYIGAEAPPVQMDSVIDCRGKLLLPGFVNTHTHLTMTLLRGYGENLSLQDWLFTRIFPFEGKLTNDAVYWGTMLGLAEGLRFGTTSCTDMYMGPGPICRAADDSGCRINVSLMAPVGADQEGELPFVGAHDVLREWHGRDEGRIRIDSFVHAEYTTPQDRIELMRDLAEEYRLNMHLHLSETKSEHEECKQRHGGLTPAAYFDSLGVFARPTTVAHAVWVEDDDMRIMAERGVTVAHNPVSNLKLASGIAPVPALIRAGVNVALGTDGAASNNNLNLWEEMRLMALLHKGANYDPTLITPREALAAATVNGAVAQGREDCGTIAIGQKADLMLVDIDKPHMQPCYDMLNNLVFAAQGSDVVLTMVDGRILYHNGEYPTIDIEKVVFEVERCRKAILSQL